MARVHVGTGNGNGNKLFDPANLSDGHTKADWSGACGTLTPTGCWPLPTKLKIASDVASGASGSVSFSFDYCIKLGDAGPSWETSSGGGVFTLPPVAMGSIVT